ncbi:MAG TPA: cyclic nucleotide-binding domain-containing protein, partial [Rhizomicrobium sp.]|nr:cyclic nucleotide-binding domain-containing protein [Rhizomicrobium sp.]
MQKDLQMEDIEANALLELIEPAIASHFAAHIHKCDLNRNQVLHQPGQRAERVYFPIKGVVATFSETLAGECVQTAITGCDGAVGIFEILGSGQFSSKATVQIPGVAVFLSNETFRQLFGASRPFRFACRRHMEMALTEARQAVVCNAL